MSELGEILRSARQKRHLSLPDVAADIHINAGYLEALENGDYHILPGPAYVSGFLRNYARYLRLQADDLVQEYYASRPVPQPSVRAATRVLANGYQASNRRRLFGIFGVVIALLASGYTIKQYNDSTARANALPVNVTPANLAGGTGIHLAQHHKSSTVHLGLRSTAPAWVRVTVDGKRSFQGILRARTGAHAFTAHHSIYVVTYDGTHLRVTYDGRALGRIATQQGLTVKVATPSGWRTAS